MKKKKSQSFQPVNTKQEKLVQSIDSSEMVVVEGPAGVGKTYVVASMAAQYLKVGTISKIIFTRPVVPCGRTIGLFPGTLEEKLANWTMPFMDVIKKYFSAGELDMFMKNQKIMSLPFEVMRGMSFDDAFIIVDEAQNSTPKEMQMLVTRVGRRSKTVILGDSTQSDLRQDESGLEMVTRMIHEHGLKIPMMEFSSDDIVRGGLCKAWVQAFEAESNSIPRFLMNKNLTTK